MKSYSSIFLLLVFSFPSPGFSQSEAPSGEAIPYYDVEIVIFKNLRVPKSREFSLPVSSPAKDEAFFDLSLPPGASAVATGTSDGGENPSLDYRVLDGEDLRLAEAVGKLLESSRYELLVHSAWRQPGLDREQALPVWIRGGRIYGNEYMSIDSQIGMMERLTENSPGDENADTSFEFDEQTLEALELHLLEAKNQQRQNGLYELEGKITVALSRYLHVYTDLVLRAPRRAAETLSSGSLQDNYMATYAADTRILNNHSLREHRRMRSKTLHYLDNPEFSLLVLITPYEAPAEPEPVVEPVEGGTKNEATASG